MPLIPEKVNGTCALETETAKMFVFWPGFNFTLVFTKNPEGNSYYLNRAVVMYDKSHSALRSDFTNARTGGKVRLETIPDKNFFWTSLGKSYSCQESQDQGPLKLFNVIDNAVEGYLDFSDTRFQPFAMRANSDWGPRVQCLPRATKDIRAKMPWITGALVLAVSSLLVVGYGVQRTFFPDSKVEYDNYGEEKHEMQQVYTSEEQEPLKSAPEPTTTIPSQQISEPQQPQNDQPSANPFKQKSSNPFQTYGST